MYSCTICKRGNRILASINKIHKIASCKLHCRDSLTKSSIISSAMEALPTGGFSRPEQASFQECTATFTKIRVDIHTTDAQGVAFHGENHVTIILLVDEGKSIEIEMTAKKSSRMGQLCWRWYESRNSKSERLVYQFPTPVTVKALYRAIRAWGFDQYLFASNGLGRQFWTCVQIPESVQFANNVKISASSQTSRR